MISLSGTLLCCTICNYMIINVLVLYTYTILYNIHVHVHVHRCNLVCNIHKCVANGKKCFTMPDITVLSEYINHSNLNKYALVFTPFNCSHFDANLTASHLMWSLIPYTCTDIKSACTMYMYQSDSVLSDVVMNTVDIKSACTMYMYMYMYVHSACIFLWINL